MRAKEGSFFVALQKTQDICFVALQKNSYLSVLVLVAMRAKEGHDQVLVRMDVEPLAAEAALEERAVVPDVVPPYIVLQKLNLIKALKLPPPA